jgi:hypothetical protein
MTQPSATVIPPLVPNYPGLVWEVKWTDPVTGEWRAIYTCLKHLVRTKDQLGNTNLTITKTETPNYACKGCDSHWDQM